jgi:hypothetical protein
MNKKITAADIVAIYEKRQKKKAWRKANPSFTDRLRLWFAVLVLERKRLRRAKFRRRARKRLDARIHNDVQCALRFLKERELVWVQRRATLVRLHDMGFNSYRACNMWGQPGYAVCHPGYQSRVLTK